jgi:hypothetical protein
LPVSLLSNRPPFTSPPVLASAAARVPAAPGGYGPPVIPISSPAPKKPAADKPLPDVVAPDGVGRLVVLL